MRTTHSAAPLRARTAEARLKLATGTFFVATLAACGGGGDSASTAAGPAMEQRQSAPATIQATGQLAPTYAQAALIKDTGWSAALPALPERSSVAPTSERRTHYIGVTTIPGADGSSPALAWRSLAQFKENVIDAGKLHNGDSILLVCGGVWWNSQLNVNGKKDIYIGTYQPGVAGPSDCADGNLPTLRASSWMDPARWQTASGSNDVIQASMQAKVHRLIRNTVILTEARHPNVGYLQSEPVQRLPGENDADLATRRKLQFTIKSADRTTIGTATHPIVGADIYIKSKAWYIERRTVQNYDPSTGIVILKTSLSAPVENEDAGYYVAGKPWMLDEPGEWAQDDTTLALFYKKKPNDDNVGFMYTAGDLSNTYKFDNPTTHGVVIQDSENVTISQIKVAYQEGAGFLIRGSEKVTLSGVESLHANQDGISISTYANTADVSKDVTVEYSKITGAGSNGIRASATRLRPVATNTVLRHNWIQNTGMDGFASDSSTGAAIRIGAFSPSKTQLDVQAISNVVINSANTGINLVNAGHGGLIDGNTVIGACQLTNDCGGIYTNNWSDTKATPEPEGTTSATISNNIVVGIKGNRDGVKENNSRLAKEQVIGIYLDDLSANIEVFGNHISHASSGIYLHNASWNKVHNNTIHAVTLSSIKVSFDWKLFTDTQSQLMRGNVFHNNTLFSHRTVNAPRLNAPTQSGIQDDQQVYAQLWIHRDDPTQFFTGAHRNESRDNITINHSPADDRGNGTWRLNWLNGQLTQVSGGVWAIIHTDHYRKELSLTQWSDLVAADEAHKDQEQSPVGYRPYAVLQSAYGGESVIPTLLPGSSWSWDNGVTNVVYRAGPTTCGHGVQLCALLSPTSTAQALQSPPFKAYNGAIYRLRYTLKQGLEQGVHRMSVATSSAQGASSLGASIPATESDSNQIKHIEHFFQASATTPDAVVKIWPSNGAAGANSPLSTQYVGNVSLEMVFESEVLPPLDSLVASVVNTATTPRQFNCAEAGIKSADCSSIRDENNVPVAFPITVGARSIRRLHVHSPQWSLSD